jgi:hypothetical protein
MIETVIVLLFFMNDKLVDGSKSIKKMLLNK